MICRRKCLVILMTTTALVGCRPGPGLSDDDRRARYDDSGAVQGGQIAEPAYLPDTGLGPALREHLMILALPTERPEEADRRYAASLAQLGRSRQEAVALLAAAYRSIETRRYFERWALVKTLADLTAPEAYDLLTRIASAPLPLEQNQDTHLFSTQEEEVMIRIRAIEGLERLAVGGHQEADRDLLALASERPDLNLAVQNRAIKSYLRAGKDYEARVRRLKSLLPPERHDLITLETTSLRMFEDSVKGLAAVAEPGTARDAYEESLTDTVAPGTREPPRDQP